jgi:hypothetical protein
MDITFAYGWYRVSWNSRLLPHEYLHFRALIEERLGKCDSSSWQDDISYGRCYFRDGKDAEYLVAEIEKVMMWEILKN